MNKYKPGDRVNHPYLGLGEYVKDVGYCGLSNVLFDETPNVRYNIGENPTVVFTNDLTEEKP